LRERLLTKDFTDTTDKADGCVCRDLEARTDW
jgi:hypothetical protein